MEWNNEKWVWLVNLQKENKNQKKAKENESILQLLGL